MLPRGVDEHAGRLYEDLADRLHGPLAERELVVVEAPQERELLFRGNPQRATEPERRQAARRVGVSISQTPQVELLAIHAQPFGDLLEVPDDGVPHRRHELVIAPTRLAFVAPAVVRDHVIRALDDA